MAALFEMTQDRLDAHGMPAYEISNHARRGAECRHNLAYWRCQDYVGVGPGAHGRVTRGGVKHATRQHRLPERWLAAVEKTGTGIEETTPIDRGATVEEMLMMGLRLVEGVARSRLEQAAGQAVETRFGRNLARLVEGGFLILDDQRLAATPAAASASTPCWPRYSDVPGEDRPPEPGPTDACAEGRHEAPSGMARSRRR